MGSAAERRHEIQFKYNRLYEALTGRILSGEWCPGERLPPERELCEQYDISRVTVRDTLGRMAEEGLIERVQGKGTFVAVRRVEQKLTKLYSLREELSAKGIAHTSEIISFHTVTAGTAAREHLSLPEGERVYELRRRLFADGLPYTIETTCIPERLYPGMTRELIAEHGLYGTMQLFSIIPERATERLRVVRMSAEDASLLGVARQSTAVLIERTTFSGEKIIEYTVNIVRDNFFVYTVVLE